ncbi:Tex family protein [Salinibius halmophilus]|uniref:Tex family protein n=1 Tax=Salinibius halmophilus TaxID=1853216 RepID=UPI000E6708EB|nr:Tex family protein [Salinibius halmophilus]
MSTVLQLVANELGIRTSQVEAVVQLLDDGATVPFIARYRKEATGGLDDQQLRKLAERLTYQRELASRKDAILASIDEQGKLTDALRQQIQQALSKSDLEELYLPFKPKRETRGQKAIAAGLEPLANELWQNPHNDPEALAASFVNDKVLDTKAALEGARFILMERFAEQANVLSALRNWLWNDGLLVSQVIEGQAETELGQKFKDWHAYQEPIKKVPSHRALAMFRGRNEGVLQLKIQPVAEDDKAAQSMAQLYLAEQLGWQHQKRPADTWISEVIRWTWRVKISTYIETELFARLRDSAEAEAIKVFASNLKDLLLAAPAGQFATLGLDPGYRTGVKVAVVSDTGDLLDHTAIFPHAPQNRWNDALATLAALCKQHQVKYIAIGNGTASRETEKLARELTKALPELKLSPVMVSEAGASVYSASELAAKEFPDLDVTIRGAISIARRLQDPLAELVKIDPKAIGVGQYQHDVNQSQLKKSLDDVIEDCVNAVGVELNSASPHLLAKVAGLSATLASNIVAMRSQLGRFDSRKQLLKVPRLGPKAFEQCAGFLRIRDGKVALDNTAVHPEAYDLVEQIVAQESLSLDQLLGNSGKLKQIDIRRYVTDSIGEPTLKDILSELAKPGRDPRPEFKTAEFADGIEKISDLRPGMKLQGVVSNVTHFGAFVDIGVHQDGLVHISALSDQFVSDPREVVKAGDVVKVTVLEVEPERKRISLSMKQNAEPVAQAPNKANKSPRKTQQQPAPGNSAMADQLSALLKR